MTNPTSPPPAAPSPDPGATGEENRPETGSNPPQSQTEAEAENAADAAETQNRATVDAGVDADADANDGSADDASANAGDGGTDDAGASEDAGDGADAHVGGDADAGDDASADGDVNADAGDDAGDGADADAGEVRSVAGRASGPVGDEVVVDDATMRRALEAILMVTDEPLPVLTLARAVGRPTGDVGDALAELAAEYTEQGRGFDLREVGGGWRFYTRAEAAVYVERFVLDGQQARITQAALETLAVVAYKQPVSRARVSAIRGVNVDGVMRTLVARGLVEEAGSDTESQATLYRTTTYFLERMGMQSLDDLPELAPYLPEMDDIEEELAAQSLPPAPTTTESESTQSAEEPDQTASTPSEDEAADAETQQPAEDADSSDGEDVDSEEAEAPTVELTVDAEDTQEESAEVEEVGDGRGVRDGG
ncbi:SMC-Scp complex subunit ScpB [Kribbella sp. NPDC054772]